MIPPSAEVEKTKTSPLYWDAELLALRMEGETTRSFRIEKCREALEERESIIRSLEAKLKRAGEALEVCEKESHNYYKGDEFTEANDHFRNIYLYSSNALSQLSL